MRGRTVLRIAVDILMIIMLVFLMAYSLVGEAAHEWIGAGMFLAFAVHHILNFKWSKSIFRGKYTIYRILQTALVVFVLLAMMGSMISGVMLSKHVFRFLDIRNGRAFARNIHLVCAYWGFLMLSLHLGLHWCVMMGMVKNIVKKASKAQKWILRILAFLIAGYGVYAFICRDIGDYMFLRIQFVFFDFNEPLFSFLLDYIAIMSLFIFIGHYFAEGAKRIDRIKQKHSC